MRAALLEGNRAHTVLCNASNCLDIAHKWEPPDFKSIPWWDLSLNKRLGHTSSPVQLLFHTKTLQKV